REMERDGGRHCRQRQRGRLVTALLASVFQVHRAWAWVVITGNGLAGLWTLLAAKVPGVRTRALWWFIIFAELAIVVQVLLGVTLLVQGHHAPFFHYFYGIISVLFAAILFGYRNRLKRYRYWLYGFGGLFLMGLGIRAVLVVV